MEERERERERVLRNESARLFFFVFVRESRLEGGCPSKKQNELCEFFCFEALSFEWDEGAKNLFFFFFFFFSLSLSLSLSLFFFCFRQRVAAEEAR